MLVARHIADGYELVVEAACLGGLGPAPLRAQRECVLILACHRPALGDVLARLAHRLEREPLLEAGVREPPAERRVVERAIATRIRRVRLGRHERRARHRLDTARDEEVAVAGDHRVAGADDRRETRCAEPVHGHAADRLGQAGEQHGHAGDVAIVLARLVRAAEPDVFDLLRRHTRAVDRGAERKRREIVGTRPREPAAVPADRRTDGRKDHRARHPPTNSGSRPSSSFTARRPRSPMSSVRSLTYMATNSSAVAASMPRPKPIA